jgi:hypothetical protein
VVVLRHDCDHDPDSHDPLYGCLMPECCCRRYPLPAMTSPFGHAGENQKDEVPQLRAGFPLNRPYPVRPADRIRPAQGTIYTRKPRRPRRRAWRRFWRACRAVLRYTLGVTLAAVLAILAAALLLAGAVTLALLLLLIRGH